MATRTLYLSSLVSRLNALSAPIFRIKARYWLLLTLPWLATLSLNMDLRGGYAELLSALWVIGMTAFFAQFALGGRIRRGSLFGNIDWSMTRHRQVGKWLGILFFLHPLLILAPRFLVSLDAGITSLLSTLTAPSMLTGLAAWGLMLVFVLLAVFKRSLPIRYEVWRLLHLAAFVGVALLATLHVTQVGRHGQFQPVFNRLWWALFAAVMILTLWNHLFKPLRLKRQPFTLKSVQKVSRSDWQLTLEKPEHLHFDFEPGQFVWLNTSDSPFNLNDHPFSIASCRRELPELSFIIRELGDYTGLLNCLKPGQRVYLDGPYGSMDLADSDRAEAILLVAGGAGIGPMLSLLRGLAARQEQRPVRLIYGNRSLDQMVLQDEILDLKQTLPDFRQLLVSSEDSGPGIHNGIIDRTILDQGLDRGLQKNWSAYVCGPPAMVESVRQDLQVLGLPSDRIHYEQLAF